MADLGVDMLHTHLFDKETELSILEGEGTKAYVPEVEIQRIADREKLAAEKEAAKKAKKMQNKVAAEVEETAAEETAE